MTPVDTGRAAMTWHDYQAGLASGAMQPIPPHR
jgi:hypothetical protein